MKFLILASLEDQMALHVYYALQQRHSSSDVKLVSAEELACSSLWAHGVGHSVSQTELLLRDGMSLNGNDIGVVFNRLRYVPMAHWSCAKPQDRDYAAMEMYALILSWLRSLPCPVVNPPSARGLAGAERHLSEWFSLAQQVGLPTRGCSFTTNARRSARSGYVTYRPNDLTNAVSGPLPIGHASAYHFEPLTTLPCRTLVIGAVMVGNVPLDWNERCCRLAEESNCPILECFFARVDTEQMQSGSDGAWRFCGANPFPEVTDTESIRATVSFLELQIQ